MIVRYRKMAVESVNPSMAESAKVIVSALYLSGSYKKNKHDQNEKYYATNFCCIYPM